MGLDQYLKASRYLSPYDESEDKIGKAIAAALGLPDMEVNEATVEAGYWRKANAIHKWFVDNVQSGVDECQTSDVSREQLLELRNLAQKVVDNPRQAQILLPPQEGFFFGSTDVTNGYYMEDMKRTVEILDKALALPQGWYFSYRASW